MPCERLCPVLLGNVLVGIAPVGQSPALGHQAAGHVATSEEGDLEQQQDDGRPAVHCATTDRARSVGADTARSVLRRVLSARASRRDCQWYRRRCQRLGEQRLDHIIQIYGRIFSDTIKFAYESL